MIELFPHQITGAEFLIDTERAILADDVGLGKSYTALEAVKQLKSEKTLIISPKNTHHQWLEYVMEYDMQPLIIENDNINIIPYAKIVLINYEKLFNDNIFDTLKKEKYKIIIIDEAHRLRNSKTKLFDRITRLCEYNDIPYRFALTGTPIQNKFRDVLSIAEVLGIDDCFDGNKKCFNGFIFRRKFSETILPKETITNYWIDLLPEQLKAYELAEHEAIVYIQNEKFEILGALALMTRLRQISDSVNILMPSSKILSSKTLHLMDLIEDIVIASKNKMIIFSEYKTMCNILYNIIQRKYNIKCAMLNSDTDKPKEIEKFYKDVDILISTSSGEEGLNLQISHHVVNFDLPYNPQRVRQRIGRVKRIGQKHNVHVINLISNTGIEKRIQEILYYKSTLFNEYIDKHSEILMNRSLIKKLII